MISKKKNYRILCAYQDIFFVKEEYYNLFNVSNNIYEIYINGLFALPRIPWLYERKNQYNIKNDILDYIISNTNNVNIKDRNLWIKNNQDNLVQIEQYLRNKYIN